MSLALEFGLGRLLRSDNNRVERNSDKLLKIERDNLSGCPSVITETVQVG